MASVRRTVTLLLVFVVCVLAVASVAATPGVDVGKSPAATAVQDSSADEASLALDRSIRRLIQKGLGNGGFNPDTPAGLFGLRTRAAYGTGNVQLPPEILLDRHLLRAERLLADGNPAAALEAMNEILALQVEHDLVLQDDFNFQYAQVAYEAGRTETAIASLNKYLLAAGREGEFYREALELLDSAELRLEREEAERRRARRRAEAERRRAARWPPGHVFRDCETCPEMVVLPGSIVALGRYEVTLREYRAFAAATGGGAGGGCYSAGGHDYSWRNPAFPQTDRHPVTCMSWDDAHAYVSWLSRTTRALYRLPTLEELAGAAEGSQPGCYRDRTGRDGTCPVGTYGPNALGLSDLLGNVLEWTSRCVDGNCGRRWLHGGSWLGQPALLVPNVRGHRRTAFRQDAAGFRVTRTLE